MSLYDIQTQMKGSRAAASDNNDTSLFTKLKKVIKRTDSNEHSTDNTVTVQQVVSDRLKRNSPIHDTSPRNSINISNQLHPTDTDSLRIGSQLRSNDNELSYNRYHSRNNTNGEIISPVSVPSPRSRNGSSELKVTELPTTLPEISLSAPTTPHSIPSNSNNDTAQRKSRFTQFETIFNDNKQKLFGKSPAKVYSYSTASQQSSSHTTPIQSPTISPEPVVTESKPSTSVHNRTPPRSPVHVLIHRNSNDRIATPPRHPQSTQSTQQTSNSNNTTPPKHIQNLSTDSATPQRNTARHQRATPFITPAKNTTTEPTQLDGKSVHYSHDNDKPITVSKPSLSHTLLISTFYYLVYLILHTQIESSIICLLLPYLTYLFLQYIAGYSRESANTVSINKSIPIA